MTFNAGYTHPLVRATVRSIQDGFESTCTSVTQPNARSAIGIAWSCFATIFACTWSTVHPNIPHPLASDWQIWRHRAHLMFWGLVAPELIVLWAIKQWMGSRFLARELGEYGFNGVHGYLAQMGGFMLYRGNDRIGVLQEVEHLKPLLQGRHFVYGHYLVSPSDITFQLPTQIQIEDKSKSDGLSKALSLAQVWWFVAQCISRWTQGLILTELELATLSFATLNGAIYFLWWHKPLKVRLAFPVIWSPPQEVDPDIFVFEHSTASNLASVSCSTPEHEASYRVASSHTWTSWMHECLSIVSHAFFGDPDGSYMQVGITNTQLSSDDDVYTALLVASAAGVTFGFIHCLAWNFSFPSSIEQKLWKTASLIITIVPLILHMRYALKVLSRTHFSQTTNILFYATSALVGIYVLARIGLLIEAFITLRDLKPGATAEVSWIELFPHF